MVQLLHQMTMALPTQLPKAVAAALQEHSAGGAGVDARELQKALLISLAPVQEQVALISKVRRCKP